MSIRAIYPSIGLELPQQTSQLRMTGDCVQPVSSDCVHLCPALCNRGVQSYQTQPDTALNTAAGHGLNTLSIHPKFRRLLR